MKALSPDFMLLSDKKMTGTGFFSVAGLVRINVLLYLVPS
jgi:hypothetical protein